MTDDTDPDTAKKLASLTAALRKHVRDDDKIGYYDPMLSVIAPASGHRRMVGGYKLWPEDGPDPAQTLRILSIGNSTGVWPGANWSQKFAEHLTAEGLALTLFHGAGKGNTSAQEVVRILRDAPGIAPHLIVSLSGICDIGHLLSPPGFAFSHKYTRRVMDFVRDTDIVTDVSYGYPNPLSPAQSWCRNQRNARLLAEAAGAQIIVFLQPVQGFGRYDQTPEEAAFYDQKAKVVLAAAAKPYGQCVTEFYSEVQAIIAADPAAYGHVVDFTDVFADCPGAYRDHRHQSPKGVDHLANAMLPHIRKRLAAGIAAHGHG